MSHLVQNQHYLQISINSNIYEAEKIIQELPSSDRIIIEAGTPFIKEFGVNGIQHIVNLWKNHLYSGLGINCNPYIVADLKCMDRAVTEVQLAFQGGASAAVVLGEAPIETITTFISTCKEYGLDSMLDMMNNNQPYKLLYHLPQKPDVVMLHRGVDETNLSDKQLPIHLINKVKGVTDTRIAIAGGDTSREIQSAIFNGADIVVVWKEFYNSSQNAGEIATEFLTQIK